MFWTWWRFNDKGAVPTNQWETLKSEMLNTTQLYQEFTMIMVKWPSKRVLRYYCYQAFSSKGEDTLLKRDRCGSRRRKIHSTIRKAVIEIEFHMSRCDLPRFWFFWPRKLSRTKVWNGIERVISGKQTPWKTSTLIHLQREDCMANLKP